LVSICNGILGLGVCGGESVLDVIKVSEGQVSAKRLVCHAEVHNAINDTVVDVVPEDRKIPELAYAHGSKKRSASVRQSEPPTSKNTCDTFAPDGRWLAKTTRSSEAL
jgi:hypothetical protein